MTRTCSGTAETGERCRQAPLRGKSFCFWHDPDSTEEAEQARRLGGQRLRRDKTVEGAYDLEGLNSVPHIRRVIEIAIVDALSLENSIARVRALMAGALAAAKLLEVGELEERLEAVEAALTPRIPQTRSRR